jgi:hypothetical protein
MTDNATIIANSLSSGSCESGTIADVVAGFPKTGSRESAIITDIAAVVVAILLMLVFVNVEIP